MFAFGPCSLLGFPLFWSSRLFPVSSTLCVSRVCLYLFAILIFVGIGPIAGIISCLGYLLLAHLFVFFFLRVAVFLLFFIWRIFYLSGSALAWIDECEESSP